MLRRCFDGWKVLVMNGAILVDAITRSKKYSGYINGEYFVSQNGKVKIHVDELKSKKAIKSKAGQTFEQVDLFE